MQSIKTNNERIAKNTIMLYLRTIVIMLVSLYTSRVILNALGEEDYGIYTIVGGFIALLSFINSSMTISIQRFLNIELGKNNVEEATKIYNTSIVNHVIISLVLLIIMESIGLWLFEANINIPRPKLHVAKTVFHFSVLTACLNFLRIPNNASIIAHEKMSFYAYVSIIEALLKLATVYLILLKDDGRLEFYAFLMFLSTLLVNVIYQVYCNQYLNTCRFNLSWNLSIIKKLLSFSSWNLLGGISNVLSTHGVNILINLFFSVVVNAAMGIANQVYSAVYTFVTNFQTAINPQIIQTYASGEKLLFLNLVFRSSKFSFYLLFLIALPIILCCDEVLDVWLVSVPQYTVAFVRLYLVFLMIDAVSASLWISAQAIGCIARFQICTSLIVIINLPLIYLCFKLGYPPEFAVAIRVFVNFILFCYRLAYLKIKINFPIREYLLNVVLKCLFVSALIIPVPLLVSYIVENAIWQTLLTTLSSVIISVIILYRIGLDSGEKMMLRNMLCSKFH